MEIAKKNTRTNKIIWLIVILLAAGIVFQVANYQLSKVEVTLYGTSIDSVTIQVENILKDLQVKFGPKMKVDIHLVARQKEDGSLQSYQTQSAELADFDVAENERQLVMEKYYPGQYADYLEVRNTDVFNASWQYFANFAKIDADKVQAKTDAEGADLLKEEITQFEKLRQDLPPNSDTLPLLYINNKLYKGTVDHFAIAAAIVKPILRSYHDSLPAKTKISLLGDKISFNSWTRFQYNGISECYNNYDCDDKADWDGVCQDVGTKSARCVYSKPAEVNLTILNDQDCATCDTQITLANLKASLKGLKVSEIDVSSDEGKNLKESIGAKALPIYLFDKSVENDINFASYAQLGYLAQITDNENYPYVLAQSGTPGALLDREVINNQLDLYVMSHCPYALALENSLIKLAVDINFDLKVHYVLQNEKDDAGNLRLKLSSLNGEAEYNEDMRQLVIQKYYPEQFTNYLAERNKDITAEDWQSVADAVGIDSGEVEKKAAAEGAELLKADAQSALDLGINSSPAFLYENKYFGFGVSNLKKINKFTNLEIRSEDSGYCINTASQ